MSLKTSDRAAAKLRANAPLFAALGDENRLSILVQLGDGRPHSITQLSQRATVSRQAITKHLRVLEVVGLIRGTRRGRENLFRLEPKPLDQAKAALDAISQQWDQALLRLKSFVEDEP